MTPQRNAAYHHNAAQQRDRGLAVVRTLTVAIGLGSVGGTAGIVWAATPHESLRGTHASADVVPPSPLPQHAVKAAAKSRSKAAAKPPSLVRAPSPAAGVVRATPPAPAVAGLVTRVPRTQQAPAPSTVKPTTQAPASKAPAPVAPAPSPSPVATAGAS